MMQWKLSYIFCGLSVEQPLSLSDVLSLCLCVTSSHHAPILVLGSFVHRKLTCIGVPALCGFTNCVELFSCGVCLEVQQTVSGLL